MTGQKHLKLVAMFKSHKTCPHQSSYLEWNFDSINFDSEELTQ